MIICDLSHVEDLYGGKGIRMTKKMTGALGLFKGQTVFVGADRESRRLIISTVKLNPEVSYFRTYLEDVPGSLAKITEIFKENRIGILTGGAFSFGNLWVSEFLLDFKGLNISPAEIKDRVARLGGFVASQELTELLPRSFDLEWSFQLNEDEKDEAYLMLPKSFCNRMGLTWSASSYAIMKAWPQVKTLFIDFCPPGAKLLRISAKMRDVPGSLYSLADTLRTQVDLQAIDELHYTETSGEWMIFALLLSGEISDLKKKVLALPNVIKLDIETPGWHE
jgi:hypothetical protein